MGLSIEFNDHKLRELILYIAEASEQDPRFGAIKLNKLLFYIDFGGYRMLGHPVTGATYQHLPAGPAPRQILDTVRSLVDSGSATLQNREYFTGVQKRVVPLRTPNLSQFSEAEINLIDTVIAEFWDFNGRRISDYSHAEWGWRTTSDFEDIPYQSAWVSSEPLTPDQIEVGREVAQKFNYLK